MLFYSIQTKNERAASVLKATKMKVSTFMWTILDRATSLSQIGQKNNGKLLVTALPPAVCGNNYINKTTILYTTLYYGSLKCCMFCLCNTTIIRLRISEVHKEEII